VFYISNVAYRKGLNGKRNKQAYLFSFWGLLEKNGVTDEKNSSIYSTHFFSCSDKENSVTVPTSFKTLDGQVKKALVIS
jgi:hypothetical protein